jgi:hypothetical protein
VDTAGKENSEKGFLTHTVVAPSPSSPAASLL